MKSTTPPTCNFIREYRGFIIHEGIIQPDDEHPEPRIVAAVVVDEKLPSDFQLLDHLLSKRYDPVHAENLNKAIEDVKAMIDKLRRCRVCGCTQYNCSQCIEKTGAPCSWVEDDLCSACVTDPKIPVIDTRASQSENQESIEAVENSNVEHPEVENQEVSEEAHSTPIFIGQPTNFFSQLAGTGKSDFTLRIVTIKDKLTVGVFPGPKSKDVVPANITLSPEELDQRFFVEFISGLAEQMKPVVISSSTDTDDNDGEEEEEDTSDKKRSKPANKSAKPPKKEKPAEPSLFD